VELGVRRCGLRVKLTHLFCFDLALELELPELAEKSAFLGREPIGFFVQRLQAFGGPLSERLGPRAVGILCGERNRQQEQRD
jgi:hypothetical protein